MDTLLRLAAIALAIYASLCLLLYLMQERMIFFPQPLRGAPEGPHAQPLAIARDGATLRGWVLNADSGGPLLIYFGGNAEEVSELAGTFARLNAATVLINYRGYGESDGKPSAPALIEDAAAVVQAMRRRFGAGRRILLFGRSLGSGIAALAAGAEPVDGLILLSPYRSIAHIAEHRFPFVPVRWLLRHNIDATLAIDAFPEQVLVLHALRDRVVPTSESRALIGLLKRPPRVVEFAGEHNVPLEAPEVWQEIRAFVEGRKPQPS